MTCVLTSDAMCRRLTAPSYNHPMTSSCLGISSLKSFSWLQPAVALCTIVTQQEDYDEASTWRTDRGDSPAHPRRAAPARHATLFFAASAGGGRRARGHRRP